MDADLRTAARYLATNPEAIPDFKAEVLRILEAGPKQKVVINTCFGGFSLSNAAKHWLKDRGGLPIFEDESQRAHPLLIECVETLGESQR